MGKSIRYITTPIYYVNGKPHIGSSLTTICCDVLARFHRMKGEPVWFLTGTDEQAPKVFEAAQKAGVPTQEFVDGLTQEFKDAWQGLHIEYDDFIRTTEPRHIKVVQEVFRRLRDSGDVYSGLYEGWYCVADETFFRDSDVGPDHLCPNPECRLPLKRVQEENYFFKLSDYGYRLLAHIEANPEFLQPDFRRNEVISFIQQGLRDMSITRANEGWGIPVPDDEAKVIYVWFDALINYLAATGWPEQEAGGRGQEAGSGGQEAGISRREAGSADQGVGVHGSVLQPAACVLPPDLWPADVHLMAKEIFVRFHATLWPAMLMALGLPLPKTVYAHGWWVDAEGKKGGKRTGGLPHPADFTRELVEISGADLEIAADALRYLLLREMVFHGDTEYTKEAFFSRYNADLANDLGNLCNRAVNMLVKYFDGIVPAPDRVEEEIRTLAEEISEQFESALAEFRFNTALDSVFRLVSRMNRYIEEKAPWSLAKKGETAELAVVLYTCLEAVRIVAAWLTPVMPVAAQAIRRQLGLPSEIGGWQTATRWGGLPPGTKVAPPQPLFPRIQELKTSDQSSVISDQSAVTGSQRKEKKPLSEQQAEAPSASAHPSTINRQPSTPAYITIDDFMKVELRVANVVAAERVPNADKLLNLTLDVAGEQRTVLAGIAEMYQPDELVGKQVVVVANLQPRKMRGVESQGMLLAADVEGQAILLQPETVVPSGARVR